MSDCTREHAFLTINPAFVAKSPECLNGRLHEWTASKGRPDFLYKFSG